MKHCHQETVLQTKVKSELFYSLEEKKEIFNSIYYLCTVELCCCFTQVGGFLHTSLLSGFGCFDPRVELLDPGGEICQILGMVTYSILTIGFFVNINSLDFPPMTPCWGNTILLIRASQQLPYLGLGPLESFSG